jgi:hypothetical protein
MLVEPDESRSGRDRRRDARRVRDHILQSTWKNPAAAPLNLKGKKVVALVVTDEEALRYAAEDEAAREITAHGAMGVPAYTLLPQAQIRDKERARAIFEREGIEAVVVVRQVAKEKALSGSFSAARATPRSGDPGSGAGAWGRRLPADGHDPDRRDARLQPAAEPAGLGQPVTDHEPDPGGLLRARAEQDARHGDGEAGAARMTSPFERGRS